MARILVFQHHPKETPGRLGLTLRDHGFKLDIRKLYLDEDDAGSLPSDIDDVRGLIVLGGTQNVGEHHWWMQPELNLIRKAHDAQLPVFGICLGAQMIASALGGQVGPMAQTEAGFTTVNLTVPAQTDRLLSGQRWATPQFQVHSQEIKELPAGATLMATGEQCKIQAFKAGLRTFGFQYHFECDRAMIDLFASEYPDSFSAAGVTPEVLERQCDEHYEIFARLGDRLSLNIATLGFTFNELLKA
ncbi:MAG: type 1 glutamine amidotransferase [Planctomycetota bacterium]